MEYTILGEKAKQEIRTKARLAYGLTTVLKDDIDHLRVDANGGDIFNLKESVRDTIETLEKLVDVIAEVEYVLYVDQLKRSRK